MEEYQLIRRIASYKITQKELKQNRAAHRLMIKAYRTFSVMDEMNQLIHKQ